MFTKNSHNMLWMFLSTLVTVLVIFPHLPGVSFTGGAVMAAFVSLVYIIATVAVIVFLVIAIALASIFYLIRLDWDPKRFSPRRYFGFFLKLGLWGTVAVSSALYILIAAIGWKITSWMFASLSFAGFAPALLAAAAALLISSIPAVVGNPRRYTEAAFTAAILAEIAKAETKPSDSAPAASQPFFVDQPKSETVDVAVVNSWPTDIVVEIKTETPPASPEAGPTETTPLEEPVKDATPAPHAEPKEEPTTATAAIIEKSDADARDYPKPPVV